MIRDRSRDPIDNLARRERRQWRAAEKRIRRDHESEQMDTLIGLAAASVGVTGMSSSPDEGSLGEPVEFIIEGRRVRIGRSHRPTLSKLREGLSRAAALPLVKVARYGSYWVLTFRVATDQLVLLAEHLTLLPDGGGSGVLERAPIGPLTSAGV